MRERLGKAGIAVESKPDAGKASKAPSQPASATAPAAPAKPAEVVSGKAPSQPASVTSAPAAAKTGDVSVVADPVAKKKSSVRVICTQFSLVYTIFLFLLMCYPARSSDVWQHVRG